MIILLSDLPCVRNDPTETNYYYCFLPKVEPCGFGVRIVLLYPPACHKRRLKGGVSGILVVTFTAARCQGSRFVPWPGQKFGPRFLLHPYLCSATTSGSRASPKPGTHLKSE